MFDKDLKITGTFDGKPVDLIICQSESVPIVSEPDDFETVGAPKTEDTDTPSADPAPEVKPATDEPKNPAGNAEQL